MSDSTICGEFADALLSYVQSELLYHALEADYCQLAVEVVDARNHLFRTVEQQLTDEERGVYAFRELCAMDEDSMCLVPDRRRCYAVGRDFGLND